MPIVPSSRRRAGRGQSLVEFALVAPLFFTILFSIIEFGRAVYYVQMLNNAAREGARYAIVHGATSLCPSGPFPPSYGASNPCDPDGANVVAAVKRAAIAIIDSSPADYAVTVRWCLDDVDVAGCPGALGDGHNARNQGVRVEVAYVYRPVIAGLVQLPTFTLTGGSTLVVNH